MLHLLLPIGSSTLSVTWNLVLTELADMPLGSPSHPASPAACTCHASHVHFVRCLEGDAVISYMSDCVSSYESADATHCSCCSCTKESGVLGPSMGDAP